MPAATIYKRPKFKLMQYRHGNRFAVQGNCAKNEPSSITPVSA
jgi:hypothetical protein